MYVLDVKRGGRVREKKGETKKVLRTCGNEMQSIRDCCCRVACLTTLMELNGTFSTPSLDRPESCRSLSHIPPFGDISTRATCLQRQKGAKSTGRKTMKLSVSVSSRELLSSGASEGGEGGGRFSLLHCFLGGDERNGGSGEP